MPLPREEQHWPPRNWQEVFDRYAEWSAWYSGDPNLLAKVHSGRVYTPNPSGRFWAKKVKEERQTMLHVPIAGDISAVSSDLIFSDMPNFIIPEANQENAEKDAIEAQDRINAIVNKNETYSSFIELGETNSAIGGSFLKVNWNKNYDFPLLTVAQADSAIPKFKWGFLQEVTFYRKIREEKRFGKTRVLRHIEHHERGLIQNRLYAGTLTNLGNEIALSSDRATEDLERDIETGIDDLLVRYIPNKKPNRLWRGSSLGQSDYSGLEGLMDALDEVYTSWIRDLRLAKARIIAPEQYLEFDRNSGDFFFDEDKQVFAGLNMGPNGDGESGLTLNQFEIRSEQHEQTAINLMERIVSSAGFSPQSFGLNIEGRAESGTALRVRERKSLKTKEKKQNYMKNPLEDIFELVLKVDNKILGNNVVPYRPRIDFADSLPDDKTETADSLHKIEQAEAASIKTKVEWLHQDWSQEEIEAEVERIKEEKGITVSDPMEMA